MIDGVRVKPLTVIPDQRGRLMELVRDGDPDLVRFGQVYLSVSR